MHRLAVALLAVLTAACATAVPPSQGAYRGAAAPIYSSAVLDATRLTGRWEQVAGFSPNGESGCNPGSVEISRKGMKLHVALRLCLAGVETRAVGALRAAGPGRFVVSGAPDPGLGEPWWVLWADADYRTLVIGTPSGRFGFILNRGGALPADRLTAAREILDWNGYNIALLEIF